MADEWFWAGSAGQGDSDFGDGQTNNGYQPHNFIYGSMMTCTKSGTCTKIACRTDSTTGTPGMKIGLFDSGGNLLAQSTFTNTGSVSWKESGVISVSVSSADYIVMVSSETEWSRYFFDSADDGIGTTPNYASSMPSSISTTESETGRLYGTKMWVEDPEAGGAAVIIPPQLMIMGKRKIWQVPAQIVLAALPIAGMIKNNKMTRRELPNPWNWIKKENR